MSDSEKMRKRNPIVSAFQATRAELRKVSWPTFDKGWSMTKIVLVVTFGMAIFLGVLDFFFGWLLSNIVTGNILFIVLGVFVVVALMGAAYLIGQGEGA